MDQGRDKQPQPEPGAQPPTRPTGKLSPVQKIQQERVRHTSDCGQCADVDRRRCAVGEQLWQAWTAALDDAYRRLHDRAI